MKCDVKPRCATDDTFGCCRASATVRTVPETCCFPAVRERMRGCVIVYYSTSLLAWYLINRWWEFRQVYNYFEAVGDKDELIRFRVQKFKSQVTEKPHVVK